jgi:hypothetical protein
MSIYTKTGEKIINVGIDRDCYYEEDLVQLWATVEGELEMKRLLYISDLKEDKKGEIKDVVRATLKATKTS